MGARARSAEVAEQRAADVRKRRVRVYERTGNALPMRTEMADADADGHVFEWSSARRDARGKRVCSCGVEQWQWQRQWKWNWASGSPCR